MIFFIDDDLQKKGVEWKFDTLDANGDKNLTINEYQEFQKLVKKAVSPQRCSRSFVNICDVDSDGVLTFEEWTTCLVKKPVGMCTFYTSNYLGKLCQIYKNI